MSSFDHATLAQAFASPESQWISMGLVDADTPDSRSVQFVDENGKPLTTGPLVNVTLQPGNLPVVCRVAGWVAGSGEASWFPFVAGDEVVVAIPDGHEMAGPVIIGRMNQSLDTFPLSVAGMDPKTNTFGFIRARTPLVFESGSAILISNALTKAQLALSSDGNAVLSDGNKNHLFMNEDVIALETGDKSTFIQLHVSDKRIVMNAGGAQLNLDPSATIGSSMMFPGKFSLGTNGAGTKGHAVTTEQLMATLANMICTMAIAGFFNPASFSPIQWATPGVATTALNTVFRTLYEAQVTPVPISSAGAPGGNTSLLSPATTALVNSLANPLPTLDPTGLIPGVGMPGLLF